MNSLKMFFIDKKYGIVVVIAIIAAFILKDKVNFTDIVIKDSKIEITKNRMLNVFSNDVHKIILENIENDKPLNYIQNYELEYHEGLPEKLELGTLIYFPVKNSEFVYFKESNEKCYYPTENSLIIIEKPLEIISNDNLTNFKVIIGKNNIHI
tara:strand:+ start:278 stop:736 length:459 start_codon:yes stop_codon:yes gene_type:complete